MPRRDYRVVKPRTFRPLRVGNHAHPLVRRLFEEMNMQHTPVYVVAQRAGLKAATIGEWAYRRKPTVENLDAAFTALGLRLTVRSNIL